MKCNSINAKMFWFKIKSAIRLYKINCTINWGSHLLPWYEQCSFRFESTSKKYIIHIEDHIQLRFDKFALVKQIYTYQPLFNKNKTRYMIFNIKHLKIALYKDKILQLDIFHKTEANEIIFSTQIQPAPVYFVPVNWFKNDPFLNTITRVKNLVHCNWNISFLWDCATGIHFYP